MYRVGLGRQKGKIELLYNLTQGSSAEINGTVRGS